MGNLLKEAEIGDIVKLKVLNEMREFIVAHHGRPSDLYDNSCNGTWLLMKNCFESRQWNTKAVNDYEKSAIHSYLNDTFLEYFDSQMKGVIKEVRLPYRAGSGASGTVTGGADGLSAKVFLPSATEVGVAYSATPVEGATLEFFLGCAKDGVENRRIAYLDDAAHTWWTRSPHCTSDGDKANYIKSDGARSHMSASSTGGIRPALVLDSERVFVAGDGTLLLEDVVVSYDDSELDAVRGDFTVAYSVTAPAYYESAPITVNEIVNGTIIRTHCVESEAAQEANILVDRIADGANELVITADVEGMKTEQVIPFCLLPIAEDDNGTVQEFQDESGDPVFPATMAKAVILLSGESVERRLRDLDESMALLWENASPVSEFAGQKIKLASARHYDSLAIQMNVSTENSVSATGVLLLKRGGKGRLSVMSHVNQYRTVEWHDDKIIFSDGQYFATYGSSTATTRNTDTIPVRIYGMKGVFA